MMNKKDKKIILITGSAGLIGSSLYVYLKSNGFFVVGVDVNNSKFVDIVLDISNKIKFNQALVKISPNIIIHTAAMKGLVECEANKIKAWNINVGSTEVIVQFAKNNDLKVVYISSDVVFDGVNGNYKESDLPNPINWYGTTKHHSELLIKQISNYAICRTALVIAGLRKEDKNTLNSEIKKNYLSVQSLFPYFLINKILKNKLVKFSDKTISSPTHIDLLLISIYKIIEMDTKGVLHIMGSESISRYNFAIKIAGYLKLDKKLIKKNLHSDYVLRPKNLAMNVDYTYKKINLEKKDWNVDSLIKKITSNYKK